VTGFLAVVCALFGLAIGSFLNVVIYRVPRKESVVQPRSRCPQCDTQLRPSDNVPVVSWLLLGGRCRTCKAKVSLRYPIVELTTAALFAGVALRFGASWAVPAFCLFFAALLALALIDLEHFLLPNRIIYPTLLASVPLLLLAAAAGHEWNHLRSAVIGGLAAFAVFFVLNLVYPRGMAFGDVRLSAVIGVYLGWIGPRTLFLGLFLGFLTASIVGIGLIVARKADRKTPVPFGVFLAIGAAVAVFAGGPVIHWWMD
jgi:leader peptidase (prepilin peptidase) / N-methyltransferase